MPIHEVLEVARLVISPIAIGLILIGLFFLFTAAVGILRLPDVFTRAHAVSLTDSLGALFVLAGLALYQGLNGNLFKIFIVLLLLYLMNPVIAHATVRSALRCGLKPWSREDA